MTAVLRRVPDRWLTEAEIAAARAVLDRTGGATPARLAFVSGSLAAGLGHPLSDIDVYVLGGPEDGIPQSFRQDGHMVQVNPVTAEQARQMIRTCSAYEVTSADRWQIQLDNHSLTRAVRFAIGTVLVADGFDVPDRAVRRTVLRQVLVTRAGLSMSSHAEDILGARRLGDLGTELVTSRLALTVALDAVLAAADDLYVGDKFLLRRLARTPATADLLAPAWALLRDPAWPPSVELVTELVDRRLALATYLTTVAALDGWARPLTGVGQRWEVTAAGGPRRSQWFSPGRYGDAWGLSGPDVGFRVTEGAVRIWLALDGEPPDRVWARLGEESPAFRDVPRRSFDAGVERLLEIGAAEWQR